MGSLSNDNSDRNENSIKAIGLDHQKNNFAHALRFFVHFFVIIKRTAHLSLEKEKENFLLWSPTP